MYGPSSEEFDTTDAPTNNWAVYEIFSMDLKVKMYEVLPNSLVVPDGDDGHGIWCLSPSSGESGDLNLLRYTPWDRSGHVVLNRLAGDVQLMMSGTNSVWMHVPKDGPQLQAGIWHVVVNDSKGPKLAMDGPSSLKDAHFALDHSRTGLLVVQRVRPGVSLLNHLLPTSISEDDDQPRRFQQEIDVDFDNIQNLVDNGKEDGAYIHCRLADGWKLCESKFGSRSVTECFVCPRASGLASDGIGGVWMLKKVGKSTNRALVHVDAQGTSCEAVGRYSGTSSFGTILD